VKSFTVVNLHHALSGCTRPIHEGRFVDAPRDG
jgi:hypothetical protein